MSRYLRDTWIMLALGALLIAVSGRFVSSDLPELWKGFGGLAAMAIGWPLVGVALSRFYRRHDLG